MRIHVCIFELLLSVQMEVSYYVVSPRTRIQVHSPALPKHAPVRHFV